MKKSNKKDDNVLTPTQQVVRAAMREVSKDVRLPKCVKDGLVKPKEVNEKTEEKYFMWYDSDRYRGFKLEYGPYFSYDVELVGGKALYHSVDSLLNTSLSDSIKKRLKGARIGTKIKAHYLHSCGDMMLKCITPEQAKQLDIVDYNIKKISELRKQMYELEKKNEEITSQIFS